MSNTYKKSKSQHATPKPEGFYGYLFPTLDGWSPALKKDETLEEHFHNFVKNKMKDNGGNGDSNIPTGYTYFGQFVDHDITHTSITSAGAAPDNVRNIRTPQLDLDSVYGFDPGNCKEYVEDNGEFKVSKISIPGLDKESNDLPREVTTGTAMIVDGRNDENAIIAQLHLAFLLAHNKLMRQNPARFQDARRVLRWLYQWVVWNDFIPRFVDKDVYRKALALGNGKWRLGYADVYNWEKQRFMPFEFAGAAYRFGHSMVRNSYQTNNKHGSGNDVPVFSDKGNGLGGGKFLTKETLVQWNWFLAMSSSVGGFPQEARKIDTKIATPLIESLPARGFENTPIQRNLAARNLVRGVTMLLPSGIDVARHLESAGHLTQTDMVTLGQDEPETLWYYILKEAEKHGEGNRLGKVGSIIVCATFAALLKSNPNAWINLRPDWTPDEEFTEDEKDEYTEDKEKNSAHSDKHQGWTLASIIRLAGLPVKVGDL